MNEYSFRTFASASEEISASERERISAYTRKDVENMLTGYTASGRKYWKVITEAAQVLHHHANQIVRHEAAFVLGNFPYRDDLEKCQAVYQLRLSIRRDPSIVAQHESVEAMGEALCIASIGAGADLAKMLAFRLYHEDVLVTAEEAFGNIIGYLERRNETELVHELREWRNYKDETGEVREKLLLIRELTHAALGTAGEE